MNRYCFASDYDLSGPDPATVSPEGRWVKWAEVEERVKQLEAQNEKFRAVVELMLMGRLLR